MPWKSARYGADQKKSSLRVPMRLKLFVRARMRVHVRACVRLCVCFTFHWGCPKKIESTIPIDDSIAALEYMHTSWIWLENWTALLVLNQKWCRFTPVWRSVLQADLNGFARCSWIVSSFRGCWAMIKPWLHPITAAKVKILGNREVVFRFSLHHQQAWVWMWCLVVGFTSFWDKVINVCLRELIFCFPYASSVKSNLNLMPSGDFQFSEIRPDPWRKRDDAVILLHHSIHCDSVWITWVSTWCSFMDGMGVSVCVMLHVGRHECHCDVL